MRWMSVNKYLCCNQVLFFILRFCHSREIPGSRLIILPVRQRFLASIQQKYTTAINQRRYSKGIRSGMAFLPNRRNEVIGQEKNSLLSQNNYSSITISDASGDIFGYNAMIFVFCWVFVINNHFRWTASIIIMDLL